MEDQDVLKYKHLTPREALLIRPDADLGSVKRAIVPAFVYDSESKKMKKQMIDISVGVEKIFLEILQNAVDSQYLENGELKNIKVDVTDEKITVFSDACGIPVAKGIIDGIEMYHLTALFSRFHSSSNLIDEDKPPYTGGRNGKGAKITNVWSTYFEVQTYDETRQLFFEQIWTNNMGETKGPKVTKKKMKKGFVQITFIPDWKRFEMPEKCTLEMQKSLESCVWGCTACTNPKVKISFNDFQFPTTSFLQFAQMFQKDGDGIAYDVVLESKSNASATSTTKKSVTAKGYDHENYIARLEVCAMKMEDHHGRSSIGYVNALKCNTGLHMTFIYSKIAEHIKSKMVSKGIGDKYKLDFVKDNIFIVARVLLKNPSFDSQTKETLNGPKIKDFGFDWEPSELFLKNIDKFGIIEDILNKMDEKKISTMKIVKKPNIAKYECAENAGKKNSKCTLIIVEGDSAKNLVMSGFAVIGRANYGVYPIRGKILNVRNKLQSAKKKFDWLEKTSPDAIEVKNIVSILGIDLSNPQQKCSELNYQNVMVMTDMDPDGSHIQGLIMNIFDVLIPHILEENPTFVQRFATPQIRLTCKKTKNIEEFTSRGEYEKWMKNKNLTEEEIFKKYDSQYFKGLGSSNNKDAIRYFKNIHELTISLVYEKNITSEIMNDMFSAKKRERRKELIEQHYDINTYLDYSQKTCTWNDYILKELIPFSYENCQRAIAHLHDGLKLSSRQILFTFFFKNIYQSRKVSELGGTVIATTHYAHSETSIYSTISEMAQDYWCTNNINMLTPNGQFGSRATDRKGFASPRYIFTCLNQGIMKSLFVKEDLPPKRIVEGEDREPHYLHPILPLLLINGSNGMGSGWSHTIYPHHPLEVLQITRMMIEGMEKGKDLVKDIPYPDLLPWFVHFKGKVYKKNNEIYCEGAFEIGESNESTICIYITELPHQKWTNTYVETLEKKYLIGGENDLKKEKLVKNLEKKSRKRKIAHCLDEDDDDSETTSKIAITKRKIKKEEEEDDDGDDEEDETKTNHEINAPPFIKEIENYECYGNHLRLKLKCDRKIYEDQVKGREMKVLELVKKLSEKNMHLWSYENKLQKYDSCIDIAIAFCQNRIKIYEQRKAQMLDTMEKEKQYLNNYVRFIKEVALKKTMQLFDQSESVLYQELLEKQYDQIDGSYDYLLEKVKAKQFTKESIQKMLKDMEKLKKDYEKLKNTSVYDLWRFDLNQFEEDYVALDQRRKEESEQFLEFQKTNEKIPKKRKMN